MVRIFLSIFHFMLIFRRHNVGEFPPTLLLGHTPVSDWKIHVMQVCFNINILRISKWRNGCSRRPSLTFLFYVISWAHHEQFYSSPLFDYITILFNVWGGRAPQTTCCQVPLGLEHNSPWAFGVTLY